MEWFPVFTLVLGSCLTVIGGMLSDYYRHKWEGERDLRDRRLQASELTASRQLDFLLKLQEAGATLLKATDAAYDAKCRALEVEGEWSEEVLDGDVREMRRSARIEAETLRVLIDDDKLRTLTAEVLSLETEVVSAPSVEEATDALGTMRVSFAEANEELGVAYRKLAYGSSKLSITDE